MNATAKINEIENKKTVDKFNDLKFWFFENSKIDKVLVKLASKK